MTLKIAEVLISRALPGALNLLVLLLLAQRLSPAAFGEYSTVVAATGFVSSVVFGVLAFTIVAQHAKLDAVGKREEYESSIFTTTLVAALILSVLLGLICAIGLLPASYIAPSAALGVYTVALELPRARLMYWIYGVASLLQSLVLLGMCYILVVEQQDQNVALIAFSLSYLIGALVSLSLTGWPRFVRPSWALLEQTVRGGAAYTVSLVFENALYLGMRLIITAIGTPHQLGVFSFCVDFAQRVVGVFANLISFALVPVAFKRQAISHTSFSSTLMRGGGTAVVLCSIALAVVHLLRIAEIVPVLNGQLFDPAVFTVASLSIMLNRIKKITIDPLAMREQLTSTIAAGFAIGAPIAIALPFFSRPDAPLGYAISYLVGYILASLTTTVVLVWRIRRRCL